MNFKYLHFGFFKFRGFPFAWDIWTTEGVITPSQPVLPHDINYLILILNIFLISLVWFGSLYFIGNLRRNEKKSVRDIIFLSLLLSLVTTYFTHRYINIGYNNVYRQMLNEVSLMIHPFILSKFHIESFNINYIIYTLNYLINLYFCLITVCVFALGDLVVRKKRILAVPLPPPGYDKH